MQRGKKIIAIFAALTLILMSFSGCSQTGDTTESSQTTEATTVSPTDSEAVSYTGTAKGFGGEVSVTITFEGDQMVSVTAEGPDETEGVGSKAIEALPAAILEAGSADVDGITGASYSSAAVKEAAASAIAQANGEVVSDLPALEMTPGTYEGKAKGYSGTIVVSVDVSEDAILSIDVTDNVPQENEMIDRTFWAAKYSIAMLSDTPQILKTAADRLPDRIVESQSLMVDAVTGATSSSNGILNAVKDAVVQAGGDPAALNRPIEKSTAEESYEADVVVIGGGTSGATAAAAAKDEGANVILIEKSGRVGGTGALSSQPMTFGATIQKENGVDSDVDATFKEWMNQTHWYVNGGILRRFLGTTGSTVDWLAEKGFNWTLTPGITGLVDYADDSLNSMGVAESFEKMVSDVDHVFYETTATSLVQDADGSIVGVVAERYDGTTISIKTKAVVIATGGFLGNMDLMKQYNNGNSYQIFGLAQNVGEGFEMALDAGAMEWNAGGVCGHLTDVAGRVEGFDIYDTSIPYTLSITPTLLKVNPRGERFMSENSKADSMTASTNMAFANGPYNYTIVSQSQLEALKAEGLAGTGMDTVPAGAHFFLQPLSPDYQMTNIEAVFEAGMEIGLVYKGDTLEALAENAGMDAATFTANVERYNEMCEAGVDTYFNKPSQYMNTLGESGPYYAIKSVPLAYSSLGGVRIDENMQALDENGVAIKGLYAVGMDSIGAVMDGVAYPDLYGMALGWGFNSGRIGGMEAAKAVLSAE